MLLSKPSLHKLRSIHTNIIPTGIPTLLSTGIKPAAVVRFRSEWFKTIPNVNLKSPEYKIQGFLVFSWGEMMGTFSIETGFIPVFARWASQYYRRA